MISWLLPYHISAGDSHCLIKQIPNESVDLILTDPPYNLAQHSTGNIPLPGRSAMNNDLAPWDLIEFKPEEWVDEFIRILKPTGNLFIFTSYNQIGKWYDLLDERFDATNFLVWHKTNPAPKIFKAGFLNSCEMVYTCWNKKHTWNFISQAEMHNFIESPICMRPERLSNPKHPAQKPVAILKKLITIASNENDVVFDPFMGVGSTGVAALMLNRKFIGFEINPEYYKAAEMRIKEQSLIASLFEPQATHSAVPNSMNRFSDLKPIIKWPGGKEKEISHIRRYAPEYFDNYYEPFVGGGSVFMSFTAQHLLINDKSEELISLYRAIAIQDQTVFRWINEIISAWNNMLQFVALHRELVDWYLDLRNGKCGENTTKGKLHLFVQKEWENLRDVLPSAFEWKLNLYKNELSGTLIHKVLRMHKIEMERGHMPDADIFDNIETAFMGALYMYFRGLYNDVELMQQNAALRTALFVYLRNYAYSGMFRYNANGEFNVPYGGISYNHKLMNTKIEYYKSKEVLEHFAETTITNLDFEEFFRTYPPKDKDFIFLDPPYDTEFSTYAKNEFGKDDQIRLANYLCNECKGKWLMIIKYTDVEHLIITNYQNKYD